MKSLFALLLVLGVVFQPALLRAAEQAPADAGKKAAAEATDTLEDANADLEDWELGKDDLAAEDEEDLKLDEEEAVTADGAKAAIPAADAKK